MAKLLVYWQVCWWKKNFCCTGASQEMYGSSKGPMRQWMLTPSSVPPLFDVNKTEIESYYQLARVTLYLDEVIVRNPSGQWQVIVRNPYGQ